MNDNNNSSVEVIVEDLEKNPRCPHGPTLLFKRKGSSGIEYYACSASRDRKECYFYHKKEEQITDQKFKKWEKLNKTLIPFLNGRKTFINYMKIKALDQTRRSYCQICKELFDSSETKHEKCRTINNLSDHQLVHPSELITLLENNKTHAQYLFTEQAVKTVVTLLEQLGVKKVICIGTPKIHEFITNNKNKEMTSLLMDIDSRYMSFYSPLQFIWYNMFNNHFFDKNSHSVLSDFMETDKKLVIVIDPPFGGRVEPLAYTLNKFNDMHSQISLKYACKGKPTTKNPNDLPVFWFFPYFMEQHLLNSFPDWTMLDYKVNYTNQTAFAARKQGSPVRIFTNVRAELLSLKSEQGYKHCKPCNRWTAVENTHCLVCGLCPSKDGKTYIHCHKCKKCVKPTYQHCDTCGRCCLKDHVCGQFTPDTKCFHCHQPGHKKRECPELITVGCNKKNTKRNAGKLALPTPTKLRKR